MWYPPFNTGAGYAMGIRAGAEMTTLEHRFVALRCKDTIAPTGTIAQGVGAKQVNAKGEVYETKYGLTTPQLAVRWALTNPAVTSAIVGVKKPEHITTIAPAADGVLSIADWHALAEMVHDG